MFVQALENAKPLVEVKSRRVGGATYQVPVEIRPERRQALGIRWLITNSRNRSEKTMFEKLAGELMDAFNNTGTRSRRKKTRIRWPKPTRPSPIINGKIAAARSSGSRSLT